MAKKIVILGGGTAGWMTAAALSRFMEQIDITLVESDIIGTVGVGEATIPHIRVFNELLGIPETEFMAKTNATFKLGIRFKGWGSAEGDYYHPFGDHGFPIDGIGFHHYWIGAKNSGENIQSFDKFSMANVLADQERFSYPSSDPESVLSTYSYAYHLDASAYAKLLRDYAEQRKVNRIAGEVAYVMTTPNNGNIESLVMTSGEIIEGDFFIDCSGFRSKLLGDVLGIRFESWKKWLPCDSALAVPSVSEDKIVPYTRSSAKSAGWCWQIPLTHRMGNGHVFASAFIEKEKALEELKGNLTGAMLKDPMLIKFEAGIREKSWYKNCVAIGLSCGFLEPLESTSIYLIEVAILKLLELFPTSDDWVVEAEEYNRQMENEYMKIRDFIILHYAVNQRSEEFWRYCASMSLPESLNSKINIFKATSQIVEYDSGLFMPPSWLAVYLGQGLIPEAPDSRLSREKISESLSLLRQIPEHLKNVARQINPYVSQNEANRSRPSMSLYGTRR